MTAERLRPEGCPCLNHKIPLQTARLLNCSNKKVYLWYHRTKQLIDEFEETGADITDVEIERLLRKFLKDRQRSGAPLFYTPEQQCAIVAMATEKPRKYAVESDFWTHRELAYVSNKTGVTVNISKSTVGRILAEADLKPHRIKYWEFPNIEDRDLFDIRVAEICNLYREAENNLKHNIHTISVDEKTGMQALERINPDKNALPAKTAKFEFEYSRHGTQALIPGFEVGTGRIISHRIGATKTADDFAALIEDTINLDSEAEWIFIADQLNTHKSAELVKLLAEKLDIKDDLGKKGTNGILKNLRSREDFLSDKKHRIRFVYTPKHCSWLNQIEIWFGILTRKILRHGNFKSIAELRKRIADFIEYYNQTMAKVFKWTYKGKLLQA